MAFKSLFQDARDYQILFLSTFLALGVWGRDFTLQTHHLVAVTLSALVTQLLVNQAMLRKDPHAKTSLRSAWITAISLCLLLRANSVWTMLFAGVVSIACKSVFRFRSKHFFNPSNFGIIAALLITSDAWVSPGQWGQDVFYLFLFVGAGATVVRKVGRLDTTIVFLLLYGGLEGARNAWLGWTSDVFFHRVSSGGLLLFSFFMITDPRAIPDDRRARILWTAAVAVLAFFLRNKYFMPTAIFRSLFILSPVSLLLDWIWPAQRFQWTEKEDSPMAVPAPVAAMKGGLHT